MALPPNTSFEFKQLVEAYRTHPIEFPALKAVSLAQWALESGWGTSDLARKHFNFGGAKWRKYMASWASSVSYAAHDGRTDYCHFPTLQKWIDGYWGRFDKESAYAGWRIHAPVGGNAFLHFIGPIWLGLGAQKGVAYVRDVNRILTTYNLQDEVKNESTAQSPADGDGHNVHPIWDRLRD